ncbi:uncharacterized protein LOC143864310 [Tasmannia lanceolata]|uniref:uncharacterized protein LOC143864310 n=1 Tax=Tasmannia lanceolata TaxID=3420 RepID=UPI00406426EC
MCGFIKRRSLIWMKVKRNEGLCMVPLKSSCSLSVLHKLGIKMQEVAGERGGYLHGRGALDSDDFLYLKEQMEAEEDAERLLRRTEKRAFAAFKKAASLADSSPAPLPLPLRVERKTKSGIRQQDLLKNIVEIKPKRPIVSSPSDGNKSNPILPGPTPMNEKTEQTSAKSLSSSKLSNAKEMKTKPENAVRSLLCIAYESSDEDDE